MESQLGGQPPVLRVRFYNATSSRLVNLRIQAFARIRSTGKPLSVSNVALRIAQGDDLELKDSAFWALSRPGVPFTVHIPLGEGISAKETYHGDEVVLPGRSEAIARDRIAIFVLASGTSLETGTSFSSGYEYSLTDDLLLGHYSEIDVVYSNAPRTWDGWDRFEENREMFVFGYASLVSPRSVAQTVGHPVDPSSFSYANLSGWTRTWSVGSDKTSHPERTFRKADGSEFDGVSVVMGLDPAPNANCDGAVFPVSRGDLSILDIRERNYDRVDVSTGVTWAGKPDACIVYTYIPTAEARSRVSRAKEVGRDLAIRAGYLALIREAFQLAGYPDQARPELKTVPHSVVELTIEIDENLEPVRQSTLNSSYLQ